LKTLENLSGSFPVDFQENGNTSIVFEHDKKGGGIDDENRKERAGRENQPA